MTVELLTAHDAKLEEVAEQYRRAGYEVTLEPGSESLPFDLSGYQPDLVARKGDRGFIVEVKSSAARMSVDRLRTVAEQVAQHEGWRFLLVTAEDIPTEGPPGVSRETFSWQDITDRAVHAERLSEMGEREAAYLMLWIAFERMLRRQAERILLPVERLAPSLVLRHLYSYGELTMAQFDAALACQQTRNRVAHGISSPDLPEAMERLLELVRELKSEWASESSAICSNRD